MSTSTDSTVTWTLLKAYSCGPFTARHALFSDSPWGDRRDLNPRIDDSQSSVLYRFTTATIFSFMSLTADEFHQLWNSAIQFHRSKLRQLTSGHVFNFRSVVPSKIKSTIDPQTFEQIKKFYQKLYQEFVSTEEIENLRWSAPGKFMSAWADTLQNHEQEVMAQLGISRNAYR